MIPFGPFEPDKSLFNPAAAQATCNVLPVADGWGPAKSLDNISTALSEQCFGAISARNTAGNYRIFAFTQTTLNEYDSATLGWTDVTPTAGATNLPIDSDIWSTAQWGQTIITTNINDGPLAFDMDSSTEFAALAGSPPVARYILTTGEFVVLMHTSSFPNRVYWSGIGDSTHWTDGEKGSSSQDLPDGGPIMGGVRVEGGAFILQQNRIRRMQFNPSGNYTFSFSVANPSRGCVSPASIVEAAGTFFYLDEDGFYAGAEGRPIGAEKVNRYFLADVDGDFITSVQGSVDTTNKMVWWRYRKRDATYGLIGYDWQLDRWTELGVSATFLFNAHSPGYSLEALDNVSATLEGLPYSLDSRVWQGGRPAFAGFDSSHQMGFFEAANLEATLETADIPLGGSNRAFVNGFRVTTDAATHTGQISAKATHGASVSYNTAASPSTDGLIPCRSDGRLHRFKATIPAGEVWTHAHNVDAVVRRSGKR